MSAADKQKEFDELLARHVRRALPEQEGAACPDANLLAAYQEHALSAEEAAACREHFAGCPRCREILAALEVSEGIPAEEPARQAAPAPIGNEEKQAGRRLRWLVPAGVLATAMLLWIVLLEKKSEDKFATAPKQAPVQMAENRPLPPPVAGPGLLPSAPPERRAENALPAESSRSRKKDSELMGYGAGSGGGVPPAPSIARQKAIVKEKNAAPDEAWTIASNRAAQRDELADMARSPQGDKVAAKKEAAPAAEALGAVSSLPAPAVAAPPAKTETKVAMAAEDAAVLKEQAVAGRIAAPKQTNQVSENFAAGALVKQSPVTIAKAPGGQVLWRVGAMGLIERSIDGGQTWQQQTSGVTAGLLAASAPAERVCWVAGRDGTILLTTDGSSWRKISAPEAVDFIGITASDAQRATVWGRAGGHRYSTEDGGNHWTGTTRK